LPKSVSAVVGKMAISRFEKVRTLGDLMSGGARRLTLAPVKALDSGKIVTAEEAAGLIREGDTVATGGFVGIGFAEEIAVEIERLHLAKGEHPAITVIDRAI
jgi:hypothetical protein